MDILRNIEKKLLIILSDKDKIDISKINSLKEDIRLYNEDLDKKIQVLNDKKDKYINEYHNKRLINEERYEKYVATKENLMAELIKNKNKLALNNYLNEQFEYPYVVPDIYTYEHISLRERVVRDPIAKPPEPSVKPAKPTKPSKPSKPAKPAAKPAAKPTVNEVKVVKECPEGKEINPLTKRCVKICDKDKIRNPTTGKCEKIKAENIEKECPEGKEINPKTGRCVNKCKEGEVRDAATGKCVKIKK
jgi:hypothetical protein